MTLAITPIFFYKNCITFSEPQIILISSAIFGYFQPNPTPKDVFKLLSIQGFISYTLFGRTTNISQNFKHF